MESIKKGFKKQNRKNALKCTSGKHGNGPRFTISYSLFRCPTSQVLHLKTWDQLFTIHSFGHFPLATLNSSPTQSNMKTVASQRVGLRPVLLVSLQGSERPGRSFRWSLCPIRHPLSSSTCGVPGLRPNAGLTPRRSAPLIF